MVCGCLWAVGLLPANQQFCYGTLTFRFRQISALLLPRDPETANDRPLLQGRSDLVLGHAHGAGIDLGKLIAKGIVAAE